jgi:hypothetical protein
MKGAGIVAAIRVELAAGSHMIKIARSLGVSVGTLNQIKKEGAR